MPLLPALLCTLFLLTLAVGRAGAADADPRADDRKELIKVFREIEASINAQDVDRMVQQMAPDATVTWLNGEVSRGHAEIKAYYDRMVKGEKRILDRYTTAAKVGAPARFFGNGEVAVADGTTEDEFFPVARGPFRSELEVDVDVREDRRAVEGRRLAPVVQRFHEPSHGRSESGRLVRGNRLPRGRIHARLVHGPDAPAQIGCRQHTQEGSRDVSGPMIA